MARADKDTRQGVVLTEIISVSPIPPFVSGFMVTTLQWVTDAEVEEWWAMVCVEVMGTGSTGAGALCGGR